MEHILSLLQEPYRAWFQKNMDAVFEELRFCVGQPVLVKELGNERWVWPRTTQQQVEDILRCACRQSMYACAQMLRHGFVTVEGGHRIGVCGSGVIQDGILQTIHEPSSLLIRTAREVVGCAENLVDEVRRSVLILGPPGSGKTTLLRDLVRLLSDKRGERIGLVDERGEIAACLHGTPQLQVGSRTDVMVNVPKAQACIMLLRTMSPKWLAVDEITSADDIIAMEQAAYCGVEIIATAHGSTLEDLQRRPLYRSLLEKSIFEKVVLLMPDKSWTVQEVCT